MPRIVRGRAARNDAIGIWFDIAADDVAAADRMIDRIDRKIALLADHPWTGRPRDDL
jgi:toxin ParE1/3/4